MEQKNLQTALDSNQSIFFARQLELILSRTFDIEYPEIKYASLFPVSFEGDLGVDTITYRQYDTVGMSKVIANYADDPEKIGIFGKEFTTRVRDIGNSFDYSIKDIARAEREGKNLRQDKSNYSREATERKFNNICFFGDDDYSLTGLLNNDNIPRESAPADGTGASPLWVNKSAELILRDLDNLINTIISDTKGIEIPNTLILPIEKLQIMNQKYTGIENNSTVMTRFMSSHPYITRIEWVQELKGAGTGGVDVAIAYNSNPSKLEFHIPQPWMAMEPQVKNYAYEVPTIASSGGLIVFKPLSINILEGI